MKVHQVNGEDKDKGEGQKGEKTTTFVLWLCALLMPRDCAISTRSHRLMTSLPSTQLDGAPPSVLLSKGVKGWTLESNKHGFKPQS